MKFEGLSWSVRFGFKVAGFGGLLRFSFGFEWQIWVAGFGVLGLNIGCPDFKFRFKLKGLD